MLPESRCRSCNAIIYWATSPKGKALPVDAQPLKGYTLDQVGGALTAAEVYASHFTTCPQAGSWSKK